MKNNKIFAVLRKQARIVVSDTLTAYTTDKNAIRLKKPKTNSIPRNKQEFKEQAGQSKAEYLLPNSHVRAFVVEVQVRVLGWWICVWREACDFEDRQTRETLNISANIVYNILTK